MPNYDSALADFEVAPSASHPVVTPAQQASREVDRVKILQDEFAKTTDPSDRAALIRELARSGVNVAASPPVQASPSRYDAALSDFDKETTAGVPALSTRTVAAQTPKVDRDRIQANGLEQAIASQVTGAGATIAGGFHGLYTLLTTGDASKAADSVKETQDKYTYQPPQGSTGEKINSALGSNYNPLTWIPKAADAAGGYVAEKTGSPALGAAIAAGGSVLGPAALVKGARAVPLRALAGDKPLPIASRVEPTMGDTPPVVASPGAVASNTAKASPAETVTPITIHTSDPVHGVFPESAPVAAEGSTLPLAEQRRRAQVLRDIGITDARRSAISGDAKAAATDLQSSKLDNPAGNYLRSQLDNERAAITGHAEGIVRDTGGTVGTSQDVLYGRGNTIVKPLDDLKAHFDRRTSELYKAADEKSQGVPTELNKFRTVLGDDSEMTNSDRVHLRSALQSYAKSTNIIGEDGKIFSNGQQAETLRKYLGENWSPANGKFVAKLKDALDQDILGSAGEDVYKPARELWKLKKDTLDNPNGIAKVMDASGPEGINRSVPIEKIPDAIASMPVDQLSHVVKTLKSVPDELRPQADAALAEIKAHYANKVNATGSSQAGQWNAKGVRNYLKDNSARMNLVFTPEEMQKFGTLNDAGNILAKDQSYPGAAVQQHNLLRAGVAAGLQTGGAALGSTFGGVGAAIGGYVGNKAALKFGDAAGLSSARKRVVRISDLLDK